MSYIICRMIGNRLPEQWAGVIIRVCKNPIEYDINGDRAFKMCKSPEECCRILRSKYQEPYYSIYIEGDNVVITDVQS